MQFKEFNEDDENGPVQLMRQQLSQLDDLPPGNREKAETMAKHPAISLLSEPVADSIKFAMKTKPEKLSDAEGEAILYHDLISTIIMAFLMSVRDQLIAEGIGCFNMKEKTVESMQVMQDMNLVDMTSVEIHKLLGLDKNDGIN